MRVRRLLASIWSEIARFVLRDVFWPKRVPCVLRLEICHETGIIVLPRIVLVSGG